MQQIYNYFYLLSNLENWYFDSSNSYNILYYDPINIY